MLTPEQDAELDELNQLSSELAEQMQSPWEPACLARAFRSPRAGGLDFTMQAWIDLEAMRSPLLLGEMPETAQEFADAAAIFACDIDEMSAEEIQALGEVMRRAIAEGFAMNLPMTPENPAAAEQGFGEWLPIFTALVVECGLAPTEAKALRVGEAFSLLAGLRRAQGWKVTGAVFALRDMETKEGADA